MVLPSSMCIVVGNTQATAGVVPNTNERGGAEELGPRGEHTFYASDNKLTRSTLQRIVTGMFCWGP